MVLRKILNPTDHMGAVAFHIQQLTEVIIINKDENFVFVAF